MRDGKLKKIEKVVYDFLIYLKFKKVFFSFFFMKILFYLVLPFNLRNYKFGTRLEAVPYYINNFRKIKLSLAFLKKGILL